MPHGYCAVADEEPSDCLILYGSKIDLHSDRSERGFLQYCSSPLVNGRSREVQSLEIISAKTLLSLQWVFLNSSNNVKSCREFPKAVTGPFLDHYVLKTGLAFCCRNRSRTFSRTSCFSGVYLSGSIEFVTNTDFSGTSWNGRDKLLAV